MHGDSDDVVPLENVYSLYREAGEPKEMRVLKGVGHRFRSENTAIEATLEWLKDKFL